MLARVDMELRAKLKSWAKRAGIFGLLFFTVKGLLWLTVPILVAKGCASMG